MAFSTSARSRSIVPWSSRSSTTGRPRRTSLTERFEVVGYETGRKNMQHKKDNFIQAIIYLETRQCYLATAMDMSIKVYNYSRSMSVSKSCGYHDRGAGNTSLVYDSTTTPLSQVASAEHIYGTFAGAALKGIKAQTLCTGLARNATRVRWKVGPRVDFGPVTASPIDEKLKAVGFTAVTTTNAHL